MKYTKTDKGFLLRLEVGDEIFTSVKEIAEKENIGLAAVSGIGACCIAHTGVYDKSAKAYRVNEFRGDGEIVSLNGNITEMNGVPYVHLHIAIGNEDGKIIGGHLLDAEVSLTAEIFVNVMEGKVSRRVCELTGINIIDI